MRLYHFIRKLRRKRIDRQLQANVRHYHHHCWEIVVSENELLIQLQECDNHTNLLNLLVYGKSLPDYETRLMRAALKFEFLGSLVFPCGEKKTNKPPVEVYVHELFEGSYESLEEVKDEIQRIVSTSVSDEFAGKVFRKLAFVINTCCSLMAQTAEIEWEGVYRTFIEHAIEHDDFDLPEKDSIWKTFPKDIPRKGCVRRYWFRKMPENFVEKVISSDSCCNTIRW